MLQSYKYLPILKAKQGEFQALRSLEGDHKNSIIPLFEIPNVPWNYDKDEYDKDPSGHIETIKDHFSRNWLEKDFYLDGIWLDSDLTIGGSHPIEELSRALYEIDCLSIPVTGLNRETIYNDSVREIARNNEKGVCLRLKPDDLTKGGLREEIDELLRHFGLNCDEIDLVVDYAFINEDNRNIIEFACPYTINHLPYLNNWRSITLASSSFPENLTNVPPNNRVYIERSEWHLYQNVSPALNRQVSYGDYSIAHPIQQEIDPRMMVMSAAIRYSSIENWVIIKGRSVQSPRANGYGQFHELAYSLVNSNDYFGAAYSAGDEEIYQKAQRNEGPGNAATWRKIGNNHHFALMLNNL